MQYTLTKPLRRMYDLLNVLIDSDQPMSKQQVSALINCSRPTLDKAIIDANILIKGFGVIDFTDLGLVLGKSDQLNKRQVRALISNQTFIVQFLSDLLLGEINSLEDWALSHYYSVSVAYRNTKEITEFLKKIDIQLLNENNRWYLIGDSWQIRFFYFQMLKEKAIVDDPWIFKNLDYQVLNTFVKGVCQELELYLSPLAEYSYTLITAIHLSMKDHPYTVESSHDEKFHYFLESHVFDKTFAYLEDYLEWQLSKSEKGMLISSIELFPAKYLSVGAIHRRIIHSSLTDHHVYQLAIDTFDVFYPHNRSAKMLSYVLDVYSPLQLVARYHDFNFDRDVNQLNREFCERVEPDFNEKIVQLKKKIKGKAYAEIFEKNQYRLSKELYIVYKTFNIEDQLAPITVTFLSEYGSIKESFYRQKFKSLFADERLEFISAQEVRQNNLWSEVDLIITDYTLAKFHYTGRIFYIDEFVTADNLKRIEGVIIDLEIAKRNQKSQKIEDK